MRCHFVFALKEYFQNVLRLTNIQFKLVPSDIFKERKKRKKRKKKKQMKYERKKKKKKMEKKKKKRKKRKRLK